MSVVYYDLEDPATHMNYRWFQPPQIAYFVLDVGREWQHQRHAGDDGYHRRRLLLRLHVFQSVCADWDTGDEKPNVKHGYYNLKQIPECVISYIAHDAGAGRAGSPACRSREASASWMWQG